MGFDKIKIKQIRNLIILCAVLVLCIIHSNYILSKVGFVIGILSTFAAGIAIAFVINIPMSFFERKIFENAKGKRIKRIARPLSLIIALLTILAVIALVVAVVIPQIAHTIRELSQIAPMHISNLIRKLEKMFAQYPWVIEQLQKIDISTINWSQLAENIMGFFNNGLGNAVTNTVNAAGRFVSAIVRAAIAFIFALYALLQKEKLINQSKRILHAYVPLKGYLTIQNTVSLLANNFRNFITGQCLEAVILGTMFVVVLSILRIPYALLIGVLIAFMALIPIAGPFVAFVISAFLVLMVSPLKALVFAIAFVIVQQVDGNFIYPKVVGDSVGLPAIWVLAAVSAGSSLMGILGILIFIPIMATIYTLIRDNVNARNKGEIEF